MLACALNTNRSILPPVLAHLTQHSYLSYTLHTCFQYGRAVQNADLSIVSRPHSHTAENAVLTNYFNYLRLLQCSMSIHFLPLIGNIYQLFTSISTGLLQPYTLIHAGNAGTHPLHNRHMSTREHICVCRQQFCTHLMLFHR